MSTTCRSADDILDHAKQPKTDKQSADRAHFRHLSVVGFPPIFAVGSTQGTGDLASTAGSTPASMVGSVRSELLRRHLDDLFSFLATF